MKRLSKKLIQLANWWEQARPKEYLEYKLTPKEKDIESLYLGEIYKYKKKNKNLGPLDFWVATRYKRHTRLLRSLIPSLALKDFFIYDYPLILENPIRVLPKKTRKKDWAIVVDTDSFAIGKRFSLSSFRKGDYTFSIYLKKFIYPKLVYSIVKEGPVKIEVYRKESRLSPGVYNRVKYTGNIVPTLDEKIRVAYESGQQSARELLRMREGNLGEI